jgi:hypothetical protein
MKSPTLSDLLQAFPGTRFDRELRLLTWHPHGVLDDALADEIVRLIEAEAFTQEEPFSAYTEFNGLTEIHLKLGHVFQIAQHRQRALIPVKSAFVASSVVGFGVARMYAMLMKTAFVNVRAFREREEAAKWLGMPIEALAP